MRNELQIILKEWEDLTTLLFIQATILNF